MDVNPLLELDNLEIGCPFFIIWGDFMKTLLCISAALFLVVIGGTSSFFITKHITFTEAYTSGYQTAHKNDTSTVNYLNSQLGIQKSASDQLRTEYNSLQTNYNTLRTAASQYLLDTQKTSVHCMSNTITSTTFTNCF